MEFRKRMEDAQNSSHKTKFKITAHQNVLMFDAIFAESQEKLFIRFEFSDDNKNTHTHIHGDSEKKLSEITKKKTETHIRLLFNYVWGCC